MRGRSIENRLEELKSSGISSTGDKKGQNEERPRYKQPMFL